MASDRRWAGWIFAAASIVLSASGQLTMKAGMQALHGAVEHGEVLAASGPQLRAAIIWTACGLASYGVSMLSWLAFLTRYPLSLAYPLLSISYVLVYVGATHWPLLMEPATPLRSAGTLLITVGVAVVSASPNEPRSG
jgi:undecaprenyl phosphate-alpha-L-ara4N flippase subunit ArnF